MLQDEEPKVSANYRLALGDVPSDHIIGESEPSLLGVEKGTSKSESPSFTSTKPEDLVLVSPPKKQGRLSRLYNWAKGKFSKNPKQTEQ